MPNEEDPYEHVAVGALKLKGNDKVKKNKKKKKKRKVDEILEQASQVASTSSLDGERHNNPPVVKKTVAELAVERSQEKRAAERILKKASKTHKQRVEELNEYLGSLSEHYDIQKVSWTK